MAGGRPTKYKEEYNNIALDFMSEGKSIVQLARKLEVSRQTIYQWAEDHPAFSDTLSLARDWSQAHWENRLEDMMVDRNVNAPLVKLYFANRFNWRDQANEQETEAPPVEPIFEVQPAQNEVRTTNAKP